MRKSSKEQNRKWRDSHPENHKALMQAGKWRRIGRLLRIRQEHGGRCVDCGIDNPLVLDFDHTDPLTKSRKFKHLFTMQDLRAEALKCKLLCANCHRIKTWIHSDNTRWRQRLAEI